MPVTDDQPVSVGNLNAVLGGVLPLIEQVQSAVAELTERVDGIEGYADAATIDWSKLYANEYGDKSVTLKTFTAPTAGTYLVLADIGVETTHANSFREVEVTVGTSSKTYDCQGKLAIAKLTLSANAKVNVKLSFSASVSTSETISASGAAAIMKAS